MDNKSENHWIWGAIIAIILVIWIWPNKQPEYESELYNDGYEESSYGEDCIEPENPYYYDSGHYAGYAWAEENGVSSCGGNSDSFIEGCEEFVAQNEDYTMCLDN